MTHLSRRDVSRLLSTAGPGTGQRAVDQLYPMVFDELHDLAERLMVRERADHTLQPTALVHEAYLRLVDVDSVDLNGRTHFFRIAARAMRRILVDHAKALATNKRGGGWDRVSLDGKDIGVEVPTVDLIDLDRALRDLEQADKRMATIVELRFFGGMTMEEIAVTLDVTRRTVQSDWRAARMWLARALSDPRADV